jgi:hypothetical protein
VGEPGGRLSQNNFWYYYLHRKHDQVTGPVAWERLAPLRVSTARVVDPTRPWYRGHLEGFYYPHGTASILTLVVEGDLELDALVNLAVEARTQKVLGQPPLPANALTANFSDQMRAALPGGRDQQAEPGAPFTVATVIEGSGFDPDQPIKNGDEIHTALEGLCTFRASWTNDKPHDLKRARLTSKAGSKGSAHYAIARGRALWFPETFSIRRGAHTLSCLHRNLTFAAMQTDSLLGLARWSFQDLPLQTQQARSLPLDVEEAVRNSVLVLGLLYRGADDIYRSQSVQAQIDQSHLVPAINRLRSHYGDGWEQLK